MVKKNWLPFGVVGFSFFYFFSGYAFSNKAVPYGVLWNPDYIPQIGILVEVIICPI